MTVHTRYTRLNSRAVHKSCGSHRVRICSGVYIGGGGGKVHIVCVLYIIIYLPVVHIQALRLRITILLCISIRNIIRCTGNGGGGKKFALSDRVWQNFPSRTRIHAAVLIHRRQLLLLLLLLLLSLWLSSLSPSSTLLLFVEKNLLCSCGEITAHRNVWRWQNQKLVNFGGVACVIIVRTRLYRRENTYRRRAPSVPLLHCTQTKTRTGEKRLKNIVRAKGCREKFLRYYTYYNIITHVDACCGGLRALIKFSSITIYFPLSIRTNI